MEELSRPHIAAARLLRWLETTAGSWSGAAIPVDLLAEQLGLDVVPFSSQTRRAGTLGWLEPGERIVFLRVGLTQAAQRFTLAHELGHYVLHRGANLTTLTATAAKTASDPLTTAAESASDTSIFDEETLNECDDVDVDSPFDLLDETLQPGQAYSARARRETEANAFAAALLLPAEKLLPHYLELSRAQSVPASRRRKAAVTQALAARFGVSEDALLRRLAELLLPEANAEQTLAAAMQPGKTAAGAQLDRWQRTAARSKTPALIVAGPGTGKTSTLVGRVAYLVRERGVAPETILALTFSNKAAREMRERLTLLLWGGEIAADDLLALPRLPFVSTIHAFCGDLLRRYAPLAGLRPDFRLVSETDGYFLLRRLMGSLNLSYYQPLASPGMFFPALLSAISRAKDELADPERYAAAAQELLDSADTYEEREAGERAVEVASVYRAYQAALEARGDPDYGDLIRLTVRLLREQPDVLTEVRARYQHILVDEFQDINRAMGVLLHTLAGANGPLWAVGDADQAIYRFRGASPANLARFTSEYPGARVHTLRRNYRSVPSVLEAAAALASDFLPGGERATLEAKRKEDAGQTVTLATAPDDAAELHGLARAIRARYAAGRALRDQVVLCRTHRQCQRVAEALNAHGVSTRIVAPLLDQDDIKDVLAVLSLAADASGAGLLRAGSLPDHPFTRVEAQAVLTAAHTYHSTPVALMAHEFGAPVGVSAEARVSLKALAAIVGELRTAPDVATGLARYIFSLTRLGAQLFAGRARGDAAAQLHASRIAQLLALARSFEDQQRATRGAAEGGGDASANMHADWAAFLDFVRIVSVLRQDARGSEDVLTTEVDGVRVLTVHGSKGLEFPVVYLPGLAHQRFPAQARWEPAPLLPGLSEDEAAEAATPHDAHLAEEACLFYVALTRARDELVLSHAERYGRRRHQPSPFLGSVVARLGKRLNVESWQTIQSGVPGQDMQDGPRAAELVIYEPEMPLAPTDEPLRISAIETYGRCPRQYAYRYVYGLRPNEVGLATLRRTLHNTLNTLHGQIRAADEPQAISLENAWELFEQHWAAAVERDRAEPEMADAEGMGASITEHSDKTSEVPAFQAHNDFYELYRRHGRAIVERAWERIAQPSLPFEEQTAPKTTAPAQVETHFDEAITVRTGEREIAVTLDRVERDIAQPSGTAGRGRSRGKQNSQQGEAVPARFVRHRLGHGRAKPDLRVLLYAMAAEQGAKSAPATLYQHNLTTGEIEPVMLDKRKINALRKDLDEMVEGIQSGFYPPRPDPLNCPTCPFLLICPG